MKLPLSILKSFIQIDLSIEKLSEILVLLGIEVDSVIHEKPPFAKIVVGKIQSVRPHPDAERLRIAEIFDGKNTHQVVCGDSSIRENMRVPFAPVGAMFTDEEGNMRTIKETSIRGVPSSGMLCTGAELKILEEADRVLELPEEYELGKDLTALLWDPVLEISLTPNLGHCMSAIGIARELSAALNIPLKQEKSKLEEDPNRSTAKEFSVQNHDFKLCPRYMCRLVSNVTMAPSPLWLQCLLTAAGYRPINNAVDVGNYIMLKYGQPMHVFDAEKLQGKTIQIGPAKETAVFACLDGETREVPKGTLLISDEKEPVAIAGVMGGAESAVSDSTKSILIEAAYFDPMTVRIGSKRVGLRSESSQRFEKGIDPNGVETALNEAAWLLKLTADAEIAAGLIDQKQGDFSPKKIICRVDRINRLLGTKISVGEAKEIFGRLGFDVKEADASILEVFVPQGRADIDQEIDLVEEAARLYGYNHIEKGIPRCTTAQIPHDPQFLFNRTIRAKLIGLGLQEMITCDLISAKLVQCAEEFAHLKVKPVGVLHSKSDEYSILRPSLLPGLLQVVKTNLDQKNQEIRAFEMGRIHFKQKDSVLEVPMAALLLTGNREPHHWDEKPKPSDFYDLKGQVENLLLTLGIHQVSFEPSDHLSFHPSRQANVQIDSEMIGSLGEIHPHLLEKLDIKQRVFYAEIHLEPLEKLQRQSVKMKALPQFPASQRDWTASLKESTLIDAIFQAISEKKSPLLEHFELRDLFSVPDKERKNATFRFTYRDRTKTVSFEEVEASHAKLLNEVCSKLSIENSGQTE